MNCVIEPGLLEGTVSIPASKSAAHRALICASLAKGTSRLTNLSDSEDIAATIGALQQMGAKITRTGSSVTVTGKSSQLEQLAGDVAVSYLAAAAQVRQTGAVEGRYLRLRKLMSQLFDHGGFGYDAIRVCLQQQNTEELYSRWLFGLGEAPVSGSGEQRDAAAAPAQTSDEEKNTPQEPETTSEGSEAPEENG